MNRNKKAFFGLIGFILIMGMAIIGCDHNPGPDPSTLPLWEPGDAKNKFVVISDLHLGIDDSFSQTVANRPLLVQFLKRLQLTTDVSALLISGDFLEVTYAVTVHDP